MACPQNSCPVKTDASNKNIPKYVLIFFLFFSFSAQLKSSLTSWWMLILLLLLLLLPLMIIIILVIVICRHFVVLNNFLLYLRLPVSSYPRNITAFSSCCRCSNSLTYWGQRDRVAFLRIMIQVCCKYLPIVSATVCLSGMRFSFFKLVTTASWLDGPETRPCSWRNELSVVDVLLFGKLHLTTWSYIRCFVAHIECLISIYQF